VVDDEEGILEVVSDTLSSLPGLVVVTEGESPRAAEMLAHESFDMLITDIRMPVVGGVELLKIARENDRKIPVLMITAYPSIGTAVEGLKLGATDYITKPFVPDDLRSRVLRILEERTLRQDNQLLQRRVERGYVFGDIIGESSPMQAVMKTIQKVAATDVDVLITGETGTGKELVAQSIHRNSERRAKRFIPIDCGAIPESLMESEFFGHEKGSFTGAHARQNGMLELASGGTFFLDEIGELPLSLQAKLLRVLQERRFRRVGGKTEIDADVRVIAATNRDLGEEVRERRFRQDLYYRINVVDVELPPLRSRAEDIPLLVDYFVNKYSADMGHPSVSVSPGAVEVLVRYSWPGNVRELQNVLKRAIALRSEDILRSGDFPDHVVMEGGVASETRGDGFFELRAQHAAAFERRYLADLLKNNGGDVTRSCKEAGIPRGTLYRLLKNHELVPEEFRA
jgi:DNA-binding NtrC family response regulator